MTLVACMARATDRRARLMRYSRVCIAGLLVGACTEASGPLDVVRLRTEISPAVVATGDTLAIRAILTNPTNRRLNLSVGCGPPVLFEVRTSGGDLISPIAPNLTFTCERIDAHDLEPGEVDTLSIRWRVSATAGQYEVRSGFQSVSGLQRLTSPVTLTIR